MLPKAMACPEISHINALIGVGGTLAGTILGFVLRPAGDWIANRRQISARLRSIRTSILFSGTDSLANYSKAVFELRKIFVEKRRAAAVERSEPGILRNLAGGRRRIVSSFADDVGREKNKRTETRHRANR